MTASSTGAWGIALLALAGLLAPAAAAEPVIDSVEPALTIPGGVVVVRGAGFAEAGCSVTIGRENGQVLAASARELTVWVPQTVKLGEQPLVVRFGGEASRPTTVEVLAADDPRIGPTPADGIPGEPPVIVPDLIDLEPARVETGEDGLRVHALGVARYPDDVVIALRLMLGSHLLASAQATVKGGRIAADLGPLRKALFAGSYAIEAEFHLHSQPGRVRRMFLKAFPDPRERSARASASERIFVRIGSVEDERASKARRRDHVEAVSGEATRALDALEDRFLADARSAFRGDGADGAVREGDWEAWLAERLRARRAGPTDGRKRAAALAALEADLDAKGRLDEASWRAWLDEDWRPGVAALLERHRRFRDEWEALPQPEAARDIEAALGVLMRLSQVRSQELYALNGLAPHASDERLPLELDGAAAASGVAAPWRVEDLLREAAREVGLR